MGTVDHVYKGGRKADVELSDGDGITFGYVTVEADPEPHVVAYYVVEENQEAAARGIFVASR